MTVAEFKAKMPAFVNEPAPSVQLALDASATYLAAAEWTTFYTEALINWVADRIVTDRVLNAASLAGAGDATGKTVGSVSVQRDAQIILAHMADPYLRTQYGQRFKHIQRLAFGGTTVAA